MFDPFPDEIEDGEEFKIPTTYYSKVYSNSRYKYRRSPMTIYFPSRKMMFKMMRACLGIQDSDKLWYQVLPPENDDIPEIKEFVHKEPNKNKNKRKMTRFIKTQHLEVYEKANQKFMKIDRLMEVIDNSGDKVPMNVVAQFIPISENDEEQIEARHKLWS